MNEAAGVATHVKGSIAVFFAMLFATATAAGTTAAPSYADDQPALHRVKYTVTAGNRIYTQVYYLDREPAIFADWSHNPYEFVPNVDVDIGPGKPWTYELSLARPDRWAFVSASAGSEPGTPMYHCELAVDGIVVDSKDGARGVLCSIRIWGVGP